MQRRIYTFNDLDGQRTHRQLAAGEWIPAGEDEIEILPPRPTLYGLYEENIGVLTPMIVDAIREAEAEFPHDWIEDAMRYAVPSATSAIGDTFAKCLIAGGTKDAEVKKLDKILSGTNSTPPGNGKTSSKVEPESGLELPQQVICRDPQNKDEPCPLCGGKGVYALDVAS